MNEPISFEQLTRLASHWVTDLELADTKREKQTAYWALVDCVLTIGQELNQDSMLLRQARERHQ
jgi:hypothetical protein